MVAAAGDLAAPVHVRFGLADGVRVSGELTAWDEEGFDGTFGRRRWDELLAADVWGLWGRLIDAADADQWIAMGRTLLTMPGGSAWAERAFRRALGADPAAGERIEAARASAEELRRRRDERQDDARRHRLATGSPEGVSWPADPWPDLDEQAWQAAAAEVRADAEEILRRAGVPASPIETQDFLVCSDLQRLEAARWAVHLDKTHRALSRLLGVAEQQRFYWGRAVVFLFAEQDRFRLVEAERFDQLVQRDTVGICHARGPKVFIDLYLASDDDAFADTLVREAVHGFMHRYHSPRKLPAWANEGLALHVAEQVNQGSGLAAGRRREARAFVRAGGDVPAIMAMSYGEGGWPGPRAIGDAVGALLVEFMIAQRPLQFVAWVGAVKSGKEWVPALAEDYGVPLATLLETFSAWYRVNE